MQGWSRMAALRFLSGWLFLASMTANMARADDNDTKDSTTAQGKVTLTLVISGLKAGETEIEIRPGNGGCSFKPQTSKVKSTGEAYLKVKVKDLEMKTSSADHECSLAITIKEAGLPERFTRRGFRLAPPKTAEPQAMTYYLNSTALALKVVDGDRKTK